MSVYSFAKTDADGEPIDFEAPGQMRLYVASPYLGSPAPITFAGSWDAPYSLRITSYNVCYTKLLRL